MDALEGLSTKDILTAIRNATVRNKIAVWWDHLDMSFPRILIFFPLTGSSARLVCPGDFIWAFGQETDTSIRRSQSPMCGARPWGDAKDCAARLQSGIVNNVGRCTISGFGRLGNVTDFWGGGGGGIGVPARQWGDATLLFSTRLVRNY